MFLYGAAVLVLLINQNAVETSYSATTAAFVHPKHELASFNKGELARLIHQVIDSDNEYRETFDTENGRKVTKLFGVAAPLDLDYVDLTLNRALKSSNRDIANLLYKNLVANRAHAEDPSNSDFAVRIHLIKNPEVLEQYRKKLNKEHASTSSSSGYDDSLEYDRNVEKFIRRNAVLRLDKRTVHENTNYDDEMRTKNKKRNSRDEDFGRNDEDYKEKIIMSFKDTKHDDYNDNKQHSDTSKSNRHKNNYNEEPSKKDSWDDITKNANLDRKKDTKNDNYKKDNYDNDYKKNDKDDYKKRDRKEKYDDYGSNSKASKPKESKLNDWDKPKKDNSWDNWKSKSMERGDSYKHGGNRGDKPKRSEDWDKPLGSNDWAKYKKNNEWEKPKKSDDWDKPKKSDDWDKPKNYDSWGKPKKATKGDASFEREPKDNFKREKKKKATNEWDRPAGNSGGGSGTANKKPFVPKISDYYNPRPKIHDNPAVLGFKPFGRTSIPFVGKKGIYEDK